MQIPSALISHVKENQWIQLAHVCMLAVLPAMLWEQWQAAKRQWGVLREAACSATSKTWKSLHYSQHRDTPARPHLAPSRKSSCEVNGVNRKLRKRCSFESKGSLSSKFKAVVKLSGQRKAVTDQVALLSLTVCLWPRRIWLSWQEHFKYSFFSPLLRWSAPPQLPWEAG